LKCNIVLLRELVQWPSKFLLIIKSLVIYTGTSAEWTWTVSTYPTTVAFTTCIVFSGPRKRIIWSQACSTSYPLEIWNCYAFALMCWSKTWVLLAILGVIYLRYSPVTFFDPETHSAFTLRKLERGWQSTGCVSATWNSMKCVELRYHYCCDIWLIALVFIWHGVSPPQTQPLYWYREVNQASIYEKKLTRI